MFENSLPIERFYYICSWLPLLLQTLVLFNFVTKNILITMVYIQFEMEQWSGLQLVWRSSILFSWTWPDKDFHAQVPALLRVDFFWWRAAVLSVWCTVNCDDLAVTPNNRFCTLLSQMAIYGTSSESLRMLEQRILRNFDNWCSRFWDTSPNIGGWDRREVGASSGIKRICRSDIFRLHLQNKFLITV